MRFSEIYSDIIPLKNTEPTNISGIRILAIRDSWIQTPGESSEIHGVH